MEQYAKEFALIGAGDWQSRDSWKGILPRFRKILAVDGGLAHCHALGVEPSLLLGDMDSVDPELLEKYSHVEQRRLPRAKDQSDMEVLVKEFVQKGQLRIFAGGGKRLDHSLYNLSLLARYPGRVILENDHEQVHATKDWLKLEGQPGQSISLLPWGLVVKNLITKGLRWELREIDLTMEQFSLSNEFEVDEVSIHVGEGVLLVFLNQ